MAPALAVDAATEIVDGLLGKPRNAIYAAFRKAPFSVLGSGLWLFLMKMGEIFGFAMEMAHRETRGVSQTEVSQP